MKKKIIASLVLVSVLSCSTGDQILDVNEELVSSKSTSAKTNKDMYMSWKSVNLTFNVKEYNQFFSDLNNFPNKVKPLYETLAEESLTYKATPFKFINKGNSGENQAVSDGLRLKALALKFIASNDAKYRDKAIEILVAWAKINQQTWHRPVETSFIPFYEAYSMLKSNTYDADIQVIDNWIRNRATKGAYNFSIKDGNNVNKINNWEAQRICFLFYSGYILQDDEIVQSAHKAYSEFLDEFLLKGGETTDFKDRDAFVYLSYGLQSVSKSISAVYHYEGSNAAITMCKKKNKNNVSLTDVINFWEPYLKKQKTHLDFANSIFPSERIDRKKTYDPVGDLYVLDILTHLDASRIYPFVKFLRPKDTSRFATLDLYLSTLETPNIDK